MCGVAMTMYVLWTSGELQHCLALPSRETFTRLQNTSIHEHKVLELMHTLPYWLWSGNPIDPVIELVQMKART